MQIPAGEKFKPFRCQCGAIYQIMRHRIPGVDEGTYGYCEDTGEPISIRRLEARPIAMLSVEAQERHEQRERVYRKD